MGNTECCTKDDQAHESDQRPDVRSRVKTLPKSDMNDLERQMSLNTEDTPVLKSQHKEEEAVQREDEAVQKSTTKEDVIVASQTDLTAATAPPAKQDAAGIVQPMLPPNVEVPATSPPKGAVPDALPAE